MSLRVNTAVLTIAMLVAATALAKEPEELIWDDMVPMLEMTPPQSALPTPDGDMSGADFDSEFFPDEPYIEWDFDNPVESLDGKYVKLPGFIVPLESDEGGLLNEFLLVPYYGACIHTPPPPPNQVVYISLEEPFNLTSMYDAYWIIGTITTQPYNGLLANTVYRMEGEKVEKYEW